MEQSRMKTQLAGVGGLIAIVAVIAVLLGMYQKVFTPVTMIEVQAPRAGLQLDPGASVRIHGARVGEVRDVVLDRDGTRFKIALDRGISDEIPADVTASIRATTLFGAKFVQLEIPEESDGPTVRDGDVIRLSDEALEVNDVFQQAMDLLDDIDVTQLNTTLTNTAAALDGRGEKLGRLVDSADAYLKAINPHLAQMGEDFALLDQVAQGYGEVAPRALEMAGRLTTTTDLLAQEQEGFRSILTGIPGATDRVSSLLAGLTAPLDRVSSSMVPVGELVDEFAPSVPCLLNVLVQHVEKVGPVFDNYGPFISGSVSFLPGVYPYEYPENLPKFVSGLGPQCYRIATTENPGFEHITFDDGTKDVFDDSSRIVDINLESPATLYTDFTRLILGTRAAETVDEIRRQRAADAGGQQ